MGLDVKNMMIRTVSGLAYVGLLIGAIVLGPIPAAILFSVFAVLANYEISKNSVAVKNPDNWRITWLIDSLCLICFIFTFTLQIPLSQYSIVMCAVLVLFRFVAQIFLFQDQPLYSIALFTLEIIYIGLPLGLIVYILSWINNPWIIICALSMIWINDTGAYLVGSLIGKKRMFPRLSPKKSWEGFFGGLMFNTGAAFIFFYCFHLNSYEFLSNPIGWIFIGICVTVFATLGDLFESMLKRSLFIKDFSQIIPGHGGVLDRIDSLLFVVPAVLLFIYLAQLMIS